MAKRKKLKQVDDSSFSIARIRRGRGFQFLKNEEPIKDEKIIKRIKALVIPPMWNDVIISQWSDGHVQATGRDQKGRKQYIYHSQWEKQRQQKKFDKLAEFASFLPIIRSQIDKDLKAKEWSKNKVLALIVRILDQTGIRIGNQRYTDENNSYGLTTLRRKHLTKLDAHHITFSYMGKSHQQREVTIDDDKLIQFIQKVADQPGYEIFRYQENNNNWQNIDSEDVNEYIHKMSTEEFYSKDFRTWVATRLAVEYYPEALAEKTENPKRKMTNILLKAVADEIGNTPTVCRDYYVHPKIMQLIDQQKLPLVDEFKDDKKSKLSIAEQIVAKILGANI